MSEVNLSSATRAMLEAAKKDGPTATARAKVWGGVSSGVGGVAAASGAIAAATGTTGATGAAKMLALGTLLGGTLSVGLAVTVLYVAQDRKGPAQAIGVQATAAAVAQNEMATADPATSTTTSTTTATATATATATSTATTTATKRVAGAAAWRPARPIDVLAREASLVTSARSALASGDARAALQAIHDARGLSSRQLGPEELAVEAQALRALGRQDEANEADSTLRAQFPESALAR
jgi:hypothetical protein